MKNIHLSKATSIITSIIMMLGLICILPSVNVSAAEVGDTFVVDDIKYEITTTTQGEVKVIANGTIYSGEITIPSTVTYDGKDYSITSIEESAFYGCSSLTDITIPDSVDHIGEAAFCECSSLSSIFIPGSVTSLSDDVFCNVYPKNVYTYSEIADRVSGLLTGSYNKILYDLNGKSVDGDFFDVKIVKSGALPIHPTITSGGFITNGWNTMSDGTGTDYDNSKEITENITIYAKWTENTFNITYNLDGGTNNVGNTETYTYGTGLTLQSLTKEGFSFDGWFDNPEFTGSAITEISATDIGDKELWAKWIERIYTYIPNPHNKETTTEKIAYIAENLEDGDNLTIKTTTDNKTLSGDILEKTRVRTSI